MRGETCPSGLLLNNSDDAPLRSHLHRWPMRDAADCDTVWHAIRSGVRQRFSQCDVQLGTATHHNDASATAMPA